MGSTGPPPGFLDDGSHPHKRGGPGTPPAERASMHLLLFLVFGLIVGALARMVVPGKEPGGWIISMALGVAGALVAGVAGHALGFYQEGEPAGFFMSFVGAVILVGLYHAVIRRRGARA